MQLLEGKVCLVTGAARGGGEAIARRLAEHGATTVVADILDELGRKVADSIPAARYVHLNVTSSADWAAALDLCKDELGGIDVLVNNAAVLHMGAIERTDDEQFQRLFDVNAAGAFRGIRAALPIMRAAGGGSIVNVGSVDSLQGLNGTSAYCASKWALRGLTKSAALELGRDRIRVNLVCPSSGNPAMFSPWADQLAAAEEGIANYMSDRALPRAGELEELADVVVFLSSNLSSYCTGADIAVDGGLTAGTYMPGFNEL